MKFTLICLCLVAVECRRSRYYFDGCNSRKYSNYGRFDYDYGSHHGPCKKTPDGIEISVSDCSNSYGRGQQLDIWSLDLPDNTTSFEFNNCNNLQVNFGEPCKKQTWSKNFTLKFKGLDKLILNIENGGSLPEKIILNNIQDLTLNGTKDRVWSYVEFNDVQGINFAELFKAETVVLNNIKATEDPIHINASSVVIKESQIDDLTVDSRNVTFISNIFEDFDQIIIKAAAVAFIGNTFQYDTTISINDASTADISITTTDSAAESNIILQQNMFQHAFNLFSNTSQLTTLLKNEFASKVTVNVQSNVVFKNNTFSDVRVVDYEQSLYRSYGRRTYASATARPGSQRPKSVSNGLSVSCDELLFAENVVEKTIGKNEYNFTCNKAIVSSNNFKIISDHGITVSSSNCLITGNTFHQLSPSSIAINNTEITYKNNIIYKITDGTSDYQSITFLNATFKGNISITMEQTIEIINSTIDVESETYNDYTQYDPYNNGYIKFTRPGSSTINLSSNLILLKNITDKIDYKIEKIYSQLNINATKLEICEVVFGNIKTNINSDTFTIKQSSAKKIKSSLSSNLIEIIDNDLRLIEDIDLIGINVTMIDNTIHDIQPKGLKIISDTTNISFNFINNITNSSVVISSNITEMTSNVLSNIDENGLNITSLRVTFINHTMTTLKSNSMRINSNETDFKYNNIVDIETFGLNFTTDQVDISNNNINNINNHGIQINANISKITDNNIDNIEENGVNIISDFVYIHSNNISILNTKSLNINSSSVKFCSNFVNQIKPNSLNIESPIVEITKNNFHHLYDNAFASIIPGVWNNKIWYQVPSSFNFSLNIFNMLAPNSFLINTQTYVYKFHQLLVNNNKFLCTCDNLEWFDTVSRKDGSKDQIRFYNELLNLKNKNSCQAFQCKIKNIVDNYEEYCQTERDRTVEEMCDESNTKSPKSLLPPNSFNALLIQYLQQQTEYLNKISTQMENISSEIKNLKISKNENF